MFTVTFYSYKGGVGRTLAMANVACALATENKDKQVVIVDFDLEAPGIDTIDPFVPAVPNNKGGIMEYISGYACLPTPDPENLPTLRDFAYSLTELPNVHVLPAGKKDAAYQAQMCGLDWDQLYRQKQGYRFFEQLKKQIEEDFKPDYLLVDSRTGLADISGITTHQLADLVVLVFNLNRQNLDGIVKAYSSITAVDIRQIKVLLVASPVPKDQLQADEQIRQRLQKAATSMPNALNAKAEGEDGIIVVPYHPLLAIDDFTFVKDHPGYAVSAAYRKIKEWIQLANPNEVRAQLRTAYQFQKENLLEEAESEYKAILTKNPNNADANYYFGLFLSQTGQTDRAVEPLYTACRLSPNSFQYNFELGTVLSRLNRNDQAMESFQKAEALEPKNEAVLQNIANLYYKNKDHQKYLTYITKLNEAKLPRTRMDRQNPRQEFDLLYDKFVAAKCEWPEKIERTDFWDMLKGSCTLSFSKKIITIQAIIANRTSKHQIKQTVEILNAEKAELEDWFGDTSNILHEKIAHGELEGLDDIEGLKRLFRTEKGDYAALFAVCLAIAFIERKENGEAAVLFEQLNTIPTNEKILLQFYLLWGNALGHLSEEKQGAEKVEVLKQACDKYEKAIEVKPDKHEAYYNWGTALSNLSKGKQGAEKIEALEQACEKYEKAIEIKPDSDEAYNNWGAALRTLSEEKQGAEKVEVLKQVCEKFEKAIEIKPDKHEAYYNWGIALYKLSEEKQGAEKVEALKQACGKYEKAIEIKPDKQDAYNNWGAALHALSEEKQGAEKVEVLKQACEKYEKAIEIKPDSDEAYINWGATLSDLSKGKQGAEKIEALKQACEKYEKAIEIKPDKHDAYNNWGAALHALSEEKQGAEKVEVLKQACEKYEKAIEIKPDKHEAYNNWGAALSVLSEEKQGAGKIEALKQACEKYEKAIEIKPDSYEAYDNWGGLLILLSYCHIEEHKQAYLKQALAKSKRADEIEKGSGDYNMACAYSLLGQTENALTALQTAIQYDPPCRKKASDDKDFASIRSLPEFQKLIAPNTD